MHATTFHPAHRSLPSTEARGAFPPRGARVLSKVAWAEVARSLRLSVRELQVVQGVFDDATEECIAARLGISPHTVHTHIRRLHQKLSVRTRTQLVVRVVASLVTEAGPLQAGRRVLHHPRKRPPAGTNPPP